MGRENRKLIWILFSLSFFLFLLSVYMYFSTAMTIREYEVSFIVQNETLGFNIDTDSLNFGKVLPGGNAERNLVFQNNKNTNVKIEIFASESVAEFLQFQSEYEVSSGENISIPINLFVPLDLPEGEYTGRVKIQYS